MCAAIGELHTEYVLFAWVPTPGDADDMKLSSSGMRSSMIPRKSHRAAPRTCCCGNEVTSQRPSGKNGTKRILAGTMRAQQYTNWDWEILGVSGLVRLPPELQCYRCYSNSHHFPAGGGKDRGELDPHGGEVQGLESTILWEALKDAMLWQKMAERQPPRLASKFQVWGPRELQDASSDASDIVHDLPTELSSIGRTIAAGDPSVSRIL